MIKVLDIYDLILTPIWLGIFLLILVAMKSKLTTPQTASHYYRGFIIKAFGAILLGVIYQYYYGSGDTFTFFHRGSRFIYMAILENPSEGFDLLFSPSEYPNYPSRWAMYIPIYKSEPEFFIARIATICDLFTFHTYSATAVFFAFFSFLASWLLYTQMTEVYPKLKKKLAIALLYMPSVCFWGSGVLKDTVSLTCVCMVLYAVFNIFYFKRKHLMSIVLILLFGSILYIVKIYILLCLVPVVVLWFFQLNLSKIKNDSLRRLAMPIVLSIAIATSISSFTFLGSGNAKYSIENIQKTAEVTAWWISYSGDQQGGSTYTLGDLDFSITGILKKAIPAIWVALFRPHPWEVRNPLMLLSAVENLFMLYIVVSMFWRLKLKEISKAFSSSQFAQLMLLFAILFAFAIGLTTYNFGTLSRYKIPLIPFYVAGIYILEHEIIKAKRQKKIELLKLLISKKP